DAGDHRRSRHPRRDRRGPVRAADRLSNKKPGRKAGLHKWETFPSAVVMLGSSPSVTDERGHRLEKSVAQKRSSSSGVADFNDFSLAKTASASISFSSSRSVL